jgi:hypothetical protein
MRTVLLSAIILCSCASAAPREPVVVSRERFLGLSWLSGRWIGTAEDGSTFVEAYRFADDSTIRSYSFASDASLVPTDSGSIRLRAGTVRSGSETSGWVVAAISADSVTFAPLGAALNGFTWRRTSDSTWNAVLWMVRRGSAPDRVYRMRRARQP